MTEKKSSGNLLTIIVLLAVIGLGGYRFWNQRFNHDGAYTDYASAGAHVREQIDKHDKLVYVSFNTDSYNRFLGFGKYLQEILKSAMKHTGDPFGGDHLAINAWCAESECTIVEMPDKTHNLNMKISIDYCITADQERELETNVQAILDNLRLDGMSDYEKARAIYGYICSHATYDHEHVDDPDYLVQRSAYAAIKDGTAICSGIADLFYCLANSAGLDTRIKTNGDHAWNFVRIDGEYYYVDPTWDLGLSEGEWRFFLKGFADFEEHSPSPISLFGNDFFLNDSQKDYDISAFGYEPDAG